MNEKQITFETATLGGGCFWCLEAVYQQVRGVHSVVSGYAGGHDTNPNYEAVCSETTGHAEVVQIRFDPAIVSYREILTIFFVIHDPTTLNYQGHDVGARYRSVIFTHSDAQMACAQAMVTELSNEKSFQGRLSPSLRRPQSFIQQRITTRIILSSTRGKGIAWQLWLQS